MPDMTALILLLMCSAAAGTLVGYLIRPKAPQMFDEEPLGGELAGLNEATAALGGRLSSVHEMVVSLVHEQAINGQRLATVGEQAAELHLTLASHQQRGAWGELLCEDVLRWAGLQEGVHFKKQHTLPTGSRPDFTFDLADGRQLHVDVKFPMESYRRMELADDDKEYKAASKEFVGDIKRHVDAVVKRGYADPATTVGVTVIFVSHPAVFAAAVDADLDLIQYALTRRVVLADSQTLMAVLMMLKNASDAFRVQSQTRDILDTITKFSAEWDQYKEALETTDKRLNTFMNAWEALTGPRQRQLQRHMDTVAGLKVDDSPVNTQNGSEQDSEPTVSTDTQTSASVYAPAADGDSGRWS